MLETERRRREGRKWRNRVEWRGLRSSECIWVAEEHSWMPFVASSFVATLLTLTNIIVTTTKITTTMITTTMSTTTATTFSSWEICVLTKLLPLTFSKCPNVPTSNLLSWIVTKRSLYKKKTQFFFFFVGFIRSCPSCSLAYLGNGCCSSFNFFGSICVGCHFLFFLNHGIVICLVSHRIWFKFCLGICKRKGSTREVWLQRL